MTVTRKRVQGSGVNITIVVDVKTPQEIKRSLWSPGKPGDVDLKRRATAVANLAAQTAPRGKTGKLANSFVVQQARTLNGRFDSGYEVGNTSPYFLYVVKGTKPHDIVGHPYLVFDWPKGGLHPAVFRKVHHPGTAPNPFFTNAVRAAV